MANKALLNHLEEEELEGMARDAVNEIAEDLLGWAAEGGEDFVKVAGSELTKPHLERIDLVRDSCKVIASPSK